MTLASQLRERVAFWKRGEDGTDEFGNPAPAEDEVVAEVWARVHATDGRERIEAQKVTAEQTFEVTVRFREDLRPEHWIVWRDRKLNIRAIGPAEDRSYLSILAEEERV